MSSKQSKLSSSNELLVSDTSTNHFSTLPSKPSDSREHEESEGKEEEEEVGEEDITG